MTRRNGMTTLAERVQFKITKTTRFVPLLRRPLVLVLHHLSDIPPDSPLAALFRETGIIHLLRQAQLAEARHTNDLLGLGELTTTIQQLAKGSHILIEGRPEARPPRVVCHV